MGYHLTQKIVWGVEVSPGVAVTLGADDFEGPNLPKGVELAVLNRNTSKCRYVLYLESTVVRAFDTCPDEVKCPVLSIEDLNVGHLRKRDFFDALLTMGVDEDPEWLILTEIM
jgi:hypothetical protein